MGQWVKGNTCFRCSNNGFIYILELKTIQGIMTQVTGLHCKVASCDCARKAEFKTKGPNSSVIPHRSYNSYYPDGGHQFPFNEDWIANSGYTLTYDEIFLVYLNHNHELFKKRENKSEFKIYQGVDVAIDHLIRTRQMKFEPEGPEQVEVRLPYAD